jgi:hypothetical protein
VSASSAYPQPDFLMKNKILVLSLIAAGISTLASCVPLAAGAAAGYVAHKEGYRVQSPITKSGD